MKAKDLIKILQKNPEQEVKFFNGYVDDWMNITIQEETLIKEKPSHLLEIANYQRKSLGLPEYTPNDVKKFKQFSNWGFPNEFADYEKEKKNYSFKKVFLICGKKRGLSTFDRLGDIEY